MPELTLEQQIESVPIDSLHPHPRNPRQGDVGAVMLSIATNGWWDAVLVQRRRRRDTICAGHTRWRALTELQSGGFTWPDDPAYGSLAGQHEDYGQLRARVTLPESGFVPIIAYGWTDEQALRVLLADNRTSDLATYDDSGLLALLQELAESDSGIGGTGYDGDDLDALIAMQNAADADATTEPLRGDQATVDMQTAYGIYIDCRDEADQRALLEEFGGRGLTVRAMVR